MERQFVQVSAGFAEEMVRLVENPHNDLHTPIPPGDEQTLLREALVLADHNSYHLGQLVDLRRALGELAGGVEVTKTKK